MKDENINFEEISFEEINKEDTVHAEQSQTLFKQPIKGLYQSLHEELKARCAPENFMKPYEPEKVSMANELYSEVLVTDTHADELLKQLRLRAIKELGVKFSTEELFSKLSAACNPKNFTGKAYNKERLELANRLYQIVLENADNVLALEEIEENAKELIETYKDNNKDNVQEEDISFFIFVLLLIAGISILYIFFTISVSQF